MIVKVVTKIISTMRTAQNSYGTTAVDFALPGAVRDSDSVPIGLLLGWVPCRFDLPTRFQSHVECAIHGVLSYGGGVVVVQPQTSLHISSVSCASGRSANNSKELGV
jgi:hypothetical protein